jgi:hypothetical protein
VLASCTSAPKPRIFSQVDSTRASPATQQAARWAPQAYARAEQLRARAEQALELGDRASAQVLGEHALAAYYRAFTLTRRVKAEHDLASAKQRLAAVQLELSSLDEQQRRLSAEADDLEMRVKVARDAQPLAASPPASAEREQARYQAAIALATQARLLCTATRLLDDKRPSIAEHLTELEALDAALARRAGAAPIDEAVRLRSSCLRELSDVRRRIAGNDSGVADALLAELGKQGDLFPFRDDRGVVVTLRGLFATSDQLSPAAEERVAVLGRVAKAHPTFPVLVVIHSARAAAKAADERRGQVVAAALRKAGAARVDVRTAGSSLPVTEPKQRGAADRNERVEIIFVSPA